MILTLSCPLCWSTWPGSKVEIPIEVPEGWKAEDWEISNYVLCPKHKEVETFTNNCSGCVGGWQDCDLFRSYEYEKIKLTEQDFEMISKGICPKRTNGTSFAQFKNGSFNIEPVDISSRGTEESGKAFVQAIKAIRTEIDKCYEGKKDRWL